MDCIEGPGYRPSRRWYLLSPAVLALGVLIMVGLSAWGMTDRFLNALDPPAKAFPGLGDSVEIHQPGTYIVTLNFSPDNEPPPTGFSIEAIEATGHWDNGSPVNLMRLPASPMYPYELSYRLAATQVGKLRLSITHSGGLDVPQHGIAVSWDIPSDELSATISWGLWISVISMAAAVTVLVTVFVRRHTNL